MEHVGGYAAGGGVSRSEKRIVESFVVSLHAYDPIPQNGAVLTRSSICKILLMWQFGYKVHVASLAIC